jgi:hypothetical protein
MTVLRNKRGTWINQYALPSQTLFQARGRQVDYVVLKYGLAQYEAWAREANIPWLGERMGESGAGAQSGPANAALYANQLADQALQPGCIGAVINLEEADGGWHTDDGSATRRLIETFRARTSVPLFASLDTRGNRPNYPYQQVCAELCDGVMPMVYPDAFGLPADVAFGTALTPLMLSRWAGKEILPTYQTYGDADVPSQVAVTEDLYRQGKIHGANTYTLGHATDEQWSASLAFVPVAPAPAPLPNIDLAAALVALRKAWVLGWASITDHGTVGEAVALADYWRKLVGA